MNQTTDTKFDLHCIVELFGHSKIAGRCTEQNIAGTNMLRVDVPAVGDQPAFTRFFGSGAIYSINPVDEKTALFMAEKLQVKPIESWNISEILKKHSEKLLAGSMPDAPPYNGVEHEEDDDDPGGYEEAGHEYDHEDHPLF